MKAFDHPDFVRIPISEMTNPRDRKICHANSFWAATPYNEVLFFIGRSRESFSPQCNKNENITKRLMPDGCQVVFIRMAFLPEDYKHAVACLEKRIKETSQ